MIAITSECYSKTLGRNFKAKKSFLKSISSPKVEKTLKTCNLLWLFEILLYPSSH